MVCRANFIKAGIPSLWLTSPMWLVRPCCVAHGCAVGSRPEFVSILLLAALLSSQESSGCQGYGVFRWLGRVETGVQYHGGLIAFIASQR